jgi:hypothetical protein
MYEENNTLTERVEFLEDELASLKQIVQVSFKGTANELDDLEMNLGRQQKLIGELVSIIDVHFDLIKKLEKRKILEE